MTKTKFNAKLKYKNDKFLAKGTRSLIAILIVATLISMLILSLILFFVAKGMNRSDIADIAFWDVFTHMLDPGTITTTTEKNAFFVIFLIFSTFLGIILNSVLIGTISSAIDSKISKLKKGKAKVIEEGHTVIIGLNDSAYTIISELIKANENQKRGCIVVLSEEKIEDMRDKIDTLFPDTKNTEIICKSGSIKENNVLDMCSITDAKCVVINLPDDFACLKELMVISKYKKTKKELYKDFHCVCVINKEENVRPAKIIGGDFTDVLFFNQSLGRLIAHSCRYPGISNVYIDFFDLDGDEIYYEAFEELDGMKFSDVILSFRNSCAIGLFKNGKPILNPPMDTIYNYKEGDKVIHLAEDDNTSFPSAIPNINTTIFKKNSENREEIRRKQNTLILGYNSLMFEILSELDHYVKEGSKATLVAPCIDIKDSDIPKFDNLTFDYFECDIYKYENLSHILDGSYETILLLCDLEGDGEKADSDILINLVNLRYIVEQKNLDVSVITEMRLTENEKIANGENVGDLVVGSNITSLMLTQLSENRMLLPLFEEILDQKGSELYMKKVTDYIDIDNPINGYEIQKILEEENIILIGYKMFSGKSYEIISNPKKDIKVRFSENDYLIVVAEGV